MAKIELTVTAVASLDRLIVTHNLPSDTRARVTSSIEPLERFPELGSSLTGVWAGLRFVLGPWRWMVIAYRYEEATNRVLVVAIEDGRSSRSAS
ncbi:MAG: type II toxin-antitoxin system RelE/ParE family toxin [Actinomycetota bacterium]